MPLEIRAATVDDAATIAQQRHAMFVDMGSPDDDTLAEMRRRFEVWARRKLPTGDYRGWFVVDGDQIVGGAGIWVMDGPSHPKLPDTDRGLVMNVYTRPDYRKQGIARRLMETILAWCKANDVRYVLLNASSEGRPLYESLGFVASTNDMYLLMKQE